MSAGGWPPSLTLRVTLLCALITAWTTGMLGMYFFFSARNAILAQADAQLLARAEQFRRLVQDTQAIDDLQGRAALLDALPSTDRDVLILRGADGASMLDLNPNALPVPAELTAELARASTRASASASDTAELGLGTAQLHEARAPGQAPVHWVAAVARSGPNGARLEVLAAHPLTVEMQMIDAARKKALAGSLMAIGFSTLLVGWVLRQGLRPLHRIAAQAALIHPINLDTRLSEHDAPRELQQMVAVFNAMLARIATGYERLTQFSADLAHEIRTPIGALIGQTQVALNRLRSPEEYQQLLESNLEELNRLRLIVDNMLFLAQADHATLDIERSPLSMADELQKIAEYFDGPADEAGLRFTVQASGEADVNAALCRRAIHNLVVNALRYSRTGSTVRLIGWTHESGATIAVENDGLPIPAEQLDRLFDRFYRGDAARRRPAESSGLGLAIVQAIMGLHGGTARVSCTPTGTIRFELAFPGLR